MRITHVLVDEFQDTSVTQLDLIGRLTAGWEEGDGRTLFVVGDPMQSIYRFREAEVRNFLDASLRRRINNVPVECLTLARNFRSRRPVVTWVNEVFPQVLASVANPARGEVAYEPVLATLGGADDPAPTVDLAVDDATEAAVVARRVRAALDEGADSIAILVRARGHLDAILPALRAAHIPYAAVDLESLAERLPTRDLMTLMRVLTQPDDRIAALALLRAPWCGLVLADLLLVAHASVDTPVLAAIADPSAIARLSADGQARIARLRAALAPAMAERGRSTLVARVRAAWLLLGGPACVDNKLDLAGAERFFALIAAHERGGDLSDWSDFEYLAGKLYAEAPPDESAVVQVMTLHKAKGLEFDTVLLPGLARGTRHGDDPPLRWQLRAPAGGERALLLAPLHARIGASSSPDPVYRYLKSLDAEQATAELGRLLYVGCTRAKRRLHLVGAPGIAPETNKEPAHWSPAAGSALARLWPAVEGRCDPAAPGSVDAAVGASGDAAPPPLARLPLAWSAPPPLPSVPSAGDATSRDDAPPYDWAQATAAAIGTVVHRLLAQVAQEGVHAWSAARAAGERTRIVVELANEGVDPALREPAAERVVEATTRTLTDERGQWILASRHEDARSEWALAGIDGEALCHATIDRTFVADGTRWIVDFKTGRHEGGDPGAFLDREAERYRGQLERYARLVRELDSRPIRLALYFPLVDGGWREWAFSS
jgi:ATP-dependent exoDNAse (exonuclease V) beta subunit